MAEDFPRDLLGKLVAAHIDIKPARLRFARVDTGHFNTSYFVDGAGRPVVLRISPPDDGGFLFYERRMMAQEPGIHACVRSRTSAPVAEVLAYDSSRSLVDRDYLLMERLPGTPLTHFHCTASELDKVLQQTGTYLREIHEITASRYGYLGEHNCMQPQEDWASAFRVMWDKLIDDIAGTGYYDKAEAARARNLLSRHLKPFERPVTSRLLHMDIWSQNILVDAEANVSGIVDFDRALWGDKEIEFAVLDYCGITQPGFWRGYGVERDLSRPAQIRRLFYLLYEVQKYIVIYHYRNKDPAACQRYKSQVLSMMSQL